jgi:pimeloyl-ACP methyl ester carboxylesterase
MASALPVPTNDVRYQMVDVGNGITLSVALAGSTSPSSVVLLLHGWPEASYLWRGVIDPLLKDTSDRLLIMPDQRGFNRSSKPTDISQYNLTANLVPDMVSLVGKLAPGKKVDVVAHDWGGPVGWSFASMHPELTRTLTILNGPHPIQFMEMLHTDPEQQKRSSYMFLIDSKPSAMGTTIALNGMFSAYSWFDKDTKAAMNDAWTQPGSAAGGLDWYRCNVFNGDVNIKAFDDKYPPPSYPSSARVAENIPVFVIWAMGDDAFDNEYLLANLTKYTPAKNLQIKKYPGVSHWVAQEKPEEVGVDIHTFIGKSVPSEVVSV